MHTADERIFAAERLAAFNDGVIAIAVTLLVLDVTPEISGFNTNAEVWHELGRLAPSLFGFAFSFWVISRLWIGLQTFLAATKKVTMRMVQYDLALLFVIALLPFPTKLLTSVHLNQATVSIYAVTVAMAALLLAALWRQLLKDENRAEDTSTFTVFYKYLSYATSSSMFLLSIPLAYVHVWISIVVWATLGFTRLFSRHSAETLQKYEQRFNEGRRH